MVRWMALILGAALFIGLSASSVMAGELVYVPMVVRQSSPTPTATLSPAATTTPTRTPTPTRTAMPSGVVVTTSRTFHGGYANRLYVVGVIWNNTNGNRSIRDIIVTFYDSQGSIVGTCEPDPMAYYMAPDQRAPFKAALSSEPTGWVRYSVEVYHAETNNKPFRFSFSNVSHFHDGAGSLHVVGRVTNTDTRATSSMKVYFTLYDVSDQIVNCEMEYPPDLSPGEAATFDIAIPRDEPIAGWVRLEVGAHSWPW